METIGDYFEDNWRPIIKLNVVSSIIGCNNFGQRNISLTRISVVPKAPLHSSLDTGRESPLGYVVLLTDGKYSFCYN